MPEEKNVTSVVLLHGYAETPDKVWFPWLHRKLEERQIRVWAPHLPDPLKPDFERWFSVTKREAKGWGRDTVVIGHSLGGVLTLRLLERAAKRRIRACILVASPYAATVNLSPLVRFFSKRIDWPLLHRRAGEFIFVQSENDPLVPTDHALRYGEALGAKVIMTKKDGHFIGKKAQAVWREVERII